MGKKKEFCSSTCITGPTSLAVLCDIFEGISLYIFFMNSLQVYCISLNERLCLRILTNFQFSLVTRHWWLVFISDHFEILELDVLVVLFLVSFFYLYTPIKSIYSHFVFLWSHLWINSHYWFFLIFQYMLCLSCSFKQKKEKKKIFFFYFTILDIWRRDANRGEWIVYDDNEIRNGGFRELVMIVFLWNFVQLKVALTLH